MISKVTVLTHTMEMLGRAAVTVKDETVLEAGEPVIKYCPLFAKVRGIKEITPEAAAENMRFRMEQHGMFTPRRKLEMGVFVGFGASESMMTGVKRGIIDAAVSACDGAGTVITANPELIQGMGGYISGLAQTDPIPETIEGIGIRDGHVLSLKDARIDQLAGAKWAAANGFKRFAVKVNDSKSAEDLRRLE